MSLETAPAKLNLFLHLTGRRADGFHLLESLAVFLDLADEVTAEQSDQLTLRVSGPFADMLAEADDNLILKAARLLHQHTGYAGGAAISLVKNIPIGAGLGGGSADAAATLKLLNQLWQLKLPHETLAELAGELGSDVPACLQHQPVWMSGVGDEISLASFHESLHLVLIYPNKPLLSADVYREFASSNPSSRNLVFSANEGSRIGKLRYPGSRATSRMPPWIPALTKTKGSKLPSSCNVRDDINQLLESTNDLTDAATALLPEIPIMLEALQQQPGCQLARMTGSGSVCFGVFENIQSAQLAEQTLRAAHRNWWVATASSVS